MTWYKFILCLSLLHRFSICLHVNSIALSSQDLPALEDFVTANVQKNFTEQFIRVETRPEFPSRSTSALNSTEEANNEHWSLDRVLKIWDPIAISRIWQNETYQDAGISLSCGEDFTRYMTGVSRNTIWALKMMDADGKRTWGTFSGNIYWLGDAAQCYKMENEFAEWQRDGRLQRNEELPPFRVNMNSVSFALRIPHESALNGIIGARNITLGLCLPITCNTRDVERLLYFIQIQFNSDFPLRIIIDHVRNLSMGYTFWEDTTFYILLISFIVVLVLTLIGTCYDVTLRYKILRRGEEEEENSDGNAVTLSTLKSNKKLDRKVTISKLWAVKTHNGSLDIRNSNSMPKPCSEALLSFSLLVNIFKLCSLDVGVDTLAPIHGLRFYSMLWVILTHTCLIFNEISENKTFRDRAEKHILYHTVGNSIYSVDTFFFISGCLVTFLYYRAMANKRLRERRVTQGCRGQILQYLAMMLYRYFRLTPIYLLVIGLVQVSMKWYHDHSMIELSTALDYETCGKFWWRNALYINTFYSVAERCISWSWYLANDTQFYTVGTIILLIGANFLPAAAVIIAFFLIGSWVTTAIITLHAGHVPSIQDPFAHYESLYDKPWTRIGPYLIGIVTGWYLFRINCKADMKKVVVAFGWPLSLVIMICIVYGLHEANFGPTLSVLYTTLSHSAWAMCLAWILIACVTDHGGAVNRVLSWKYMYPLSRLTYCVYLVHPMLIRVFILQSGRSWRCYFWGMW
ncbi:nose resistant to fluoxetine protein 6 isoform X2 [Harpegnathos saltator]|uniref:nose resistant to fluoxetine protein 6 isoform X2 n=1 Tax=Harpegnathos saltator TaxID=610380 RepID=UPI000DBED581|nr:nose resistant to fluoxetine protein 6 isoform X2 [Harpegnathos saltator]